MNAALRRGRLIFLVGNFCAAHVYPTDLRHFQNRGFSDEQRDKEQERPRKKRRRNWRNVSEEILERSRGRRRRGNFNEEHRYVSVNSKSTLVPPPPGQVPGHLT